MSDVVQWEPWLELIKIGVLTPKDSIGKYYINRLILNPLTLGIIKLFSKKKQRDVMIFVFFNFNVMVCNR